MKVMHNTYMIPVIIPRGFLSPKQDWKINSFGFPFKFGFLLLNQLIMSFSMSNFSPSTVKMTPPPIPASPCDMTTKIMMSPWFLSFANFDSSVLKVQESRSTRGFPPKIWNPIWVNNDWRFWASLSEPFLVGYSLEFWNFLKLTKNQQF